MFEGAVYFRKTPFGYVVDDFIEFWANHTPIVYHWGNIKYVRIEGSFNFKPVRGQFCKRPHHLINWSK